MNPIPKLYLYGAIFLAGVAALGAAAWWHTSAVSDAYRRGAEQAAKDIIADQAKKTIVKLDEWATRQGAALDAAREQQAKTAGALADITDRALNFARELRQIKEPSCRAEPDFVSAVNKATGATK